MSQHRRGRITVQRQPTGAGRAVRRIAGVVQAVFGLIFVLVGATVIMPTGGLFGLPFVLIGGLFVVIGVINAVTRNGIAHRVAYDVETGVEEETIVGMMDDVDRPPSGAQGPEADSPQQRLETIQALLDDGLITREEYSEKRREILDGI